MPLDTNPAGEFVITGGRCLIPGEGLIEVGLRINGGVISELSSGLAEAASRTINASGLLVLPGIVDIHGDAFERQIMPRPRTTFPLDLAMVDSDRQLAANGITTAFHGITVSWEPGLRSLAEALRIIAAVDLHECDFLVDNRLHIRWETYAIDQMPEVISLFRRTKRPLLAFNDHTAPSIAGGRQESKIKGSADRAMLDVDSYLQLLAGMAERKNEVPDAVAIMAAAAAAHGVTMLSHDDADTDMRQLYRSLGVSIAEFPLTWEVAEEAAAGNDVIVFGAPNVVRGGSHNGAIGAEAAISRGLCGVLASDYYYPAPLHAALSLWRRGVLPIGKAWDLVSRTPAMAAGLHDRGEIAIGKRADLVLVNAESFQVAAVIAAGRLIRIAL